MKIALTGHTDKLGKSLFDMLSLKHNVLGFSRSNGFNIDVPDKIITNILDCDVFINNTYFKDYQSVIFTKLFKEWKDQPKTIINLNSSCVYHSSDWSPEYADNKKNLRNVMLELINKNQNKKVRVINLYPSTLNSDIGFNEFNKIDLTHLTNIIDWVINQPQEIEIREMSIFSTIEKKEFKIEKLL